MRVVEPAKMSQSKFFTVISFALEVSRSILRSEPFNLPQFLVLEAFDLHTHQECGVECFVYILDFVFRKQPQLPCVAAQHLRLNFERSCSDFRCDIFILIEQLRCLDFLE